MKPFIALAGVAVALLGCIGAFASHYLGFSYGPTLGACVAVLGTAITTMGAHR